jgi:FkbM family methyltransferase
LEPNPQNAARLRRLYPRVEVRQVALSSTSGEAVLRVPVHAMGFEMIGLKSSVKLALEARRIMNSDLPAPMRRGVRNAAIRLRLSEDGSLPNPVPIAGFAVSYFHEEQLRYLFKEIFLEGTYLFHSDTDRPLVLDCGSNIGMSILFFKKLYPKARITGFEPDPATFEKLRTNIDHNSLQDVTLHQCALSNETGTIDFYHSKQVEGNLMMSVRSERLNGTEKIAVPAQRLSSFINEEIDLLKMDIEGAEELVLPELAASGKFRMVRQIHLEYHHHVVRNTDSLSAVFRLLEDHGFGYQLRVNARMCMTPETFQDISIYAYRKVTD